MKLEPIEAYISTRNAKNGVVIKEIYIADGESLWIRVSEEENKDYGKITDCDYTDPWIQPKIRKEIFRVRKKKNIAAGSSVQPLYNVGRQSHG